MITSDTRSTDGDAARVLRWPVKALALTALSFLPACSTPSAFMAGAESGFAESIEVAKESAAADARVSATVTTAVSGDSGEVGESAGRITLNRPPHEDSSVRTAVLTRDAGNDHRPVNIVPLSHQAMSVDPSCEPHCFTPAEPRIDPSLCRVSSCDLYPDEYLADGGDRKLPVHYFGGERQGLDSEDTIAEYSDHDGRSHVRASNRVCVYAPRFGSIQVIEGAGSGTQIHHAVKTVEFSAVGSLERQDAVHQSVKEDGFAAVRARRRADGAESQLNAVHSQASTRAEQNEKIDQGLQAESASGLVILERLQGPRFHEELANAIVWSRDLFPEISAATSQAGEVRTRTTAQATIGIEDQRAEKSEIHIVKLADRDKADAGDTIQFTIRYINTGDYDLYNVRIVDNLTPRLQFIADSVQTDRDGEVSTQPNGEGSDVITFELDQPLPAHESGTIRFSVRVK